MTQEESHGAKVPKEDCVFQTEIQVMFGIYGQHTQPKNHCRAVCLNPFHNNFSPCWEITYFITGIPSFHFFYLKAYLSSRTSTKTPTNNPTNSSLGDSAFQRGSPRAGERGARGLLSLVAPSRPTEPFPTWNVLVLVLLQVPVEVGLLPEAPVAQVALEWLLLVVDVPHVPLQVGGNAE